MSDSPDLSFLSLLRASLADGSFARLVLSKPRGTGAVLRKVSARLLRLRDQIVVSCVETYPTRDLTRNLAFEAALEAVADWLATGFNQAHLFTATEEIQLLVSKKGRRTLLRAKGGSAGAAGTAVGIPVLETHDRVKHHPIDIHRPYLSLLGVTDAEHRLVPTMARKWKQINKFVEVLDHALDEASLKQGGDTPLEVLDFGSGKGYLTFATHDHLHGTLGLPAHVTGVDLKADMIELCNRVARQAGAEGLQFVLGDVRSQAPQRADVMIALHACDTATDHAIHAGLRAGAKVIICSPCCHQELRPQLLSPHSLRPILKHGVHLGQQAEMLTDGLRALLLEACGYDTRVFEFVSPEHTGKNKMILALRKRASSGPSPAEIWQQVDELKAFYGIRSQCLETLLRTDRQALDVEAEAAAALSHTARS